MEISVRSGNGSQKDNKIGDARQFHQTPKRIDLHYKSTANTD